MTPPPRRSPPPAPPPPSPPLWNMNPTPNAAWLKSPVPILPLLAIRWCSVAVLNIVAFNLNVFHVPLYPRALIVATCLLLEYLGYIYPFTKGLLKPATLLCSSAIYLTVMLIVGILTTIAFAFTFPSALTSNGTSVRSLMDRSGAGDREAKWGLWCGGVVGAFVVLNAVVAAGCAAVSLLGGKGRLARPLGCRRCRCRERIGDEERGERRSEVCKDEKVVSGQGEIKEKH